MFVLKLYSLSFFFFAISGPLELCEVFAINVFLVMFIHVTLAHSSTLHALYIEKLSTHGKLREHSNKVLHESRVNLRTLPRVCDVEGGTVCSKNNAFGYLDETGARTPRSRSPTPIFVPGLRQRKQH